MSKKIFYYIFCLVSLIIAGCSGSLPVVHQNGVEPDSEEESSSPTPTPASVFWTGGENIYRIGPGDVLKIAVYGEPDISGTFQVTRDGMVSWSWVGDVDVSGLSEVEITARLKEILTKNYIRQPRVDVTVKEYHSQVVYFFGNIREPGISRLGENRSLLTNLLQAGGPKVWGEGMIGILRTDRGTGEQKQIIVGLQSLLRGEKDILLKNEDIITVSAPDAGEAFISENRVYVVGAVNGPGSFSWQDNMTALDALMKAGGLAEYASGNNARLVRGKGDQKKEYRIEFDEILDGDRDKNINLLPGDLIILPESWL
jgi:polysaccharide export outer membrane protein